MHSLLKQIDEKQRQLATFQPFTPSLQKNILDYARIELTYSSNAIEGNTLSLQETALVVEKGITVAGKTITEHLEAVNHASAFDYICTLQNRNRKDLTEETLLKIHAHVLKGIGDSNAGIYRQVPVRISGSRVVMPNPLKVPSLMQDFVTWLQGDLSQQAATIAAEAHFKLVSIHPFVDGNGRTARLLMNLLLMQAGYPPASIKPESRLEYIQALEKAQLGNGMQDYYLVIYKALIQSQDELLKLLEAKS
ncbi:MAG: Fic family protein [Deltaproteobacteria bacterium]|nr:Fic family protein [Deltaproteobacteria bacterium]